MFIGEYQHVVDKKGRMFIPSKFRDGLGCNFIITKGINKCIFAFSMGEWENLSKKLRTLPLTNREAQAFIRIFFAGANESEIDKQGRILIPGNLRDYASIDKDVTVIGVFNRVEIWNRQEWEKYNEAASSSYDGILEKLNELGI